MIIIRVCAYLTYIEQINNIDNNKLVYSYVHYKHITTYIRLLKWVLKMIPFKINYWNILSPWFYFILKGNKK